MANTRSAEKRILQNERRRQRNRRYRSRLRGEVKRLRATIESGNKAAATELLPGVVATLDSLAGKRIVHRNAAARTKSRLTRAVQALGD